MVAGLKGANYLENCAKLGLETLEKRRNDRQTLFSRQDGARTMQATVEEQQNVMADHYNLTRTYLLPAYVADWILRPK
jgi:hypothetical protein